MEKNFWLWSNNFPKGFFEEMNFSIKVKFMKFIPHCSEPSVGILELFSTRPEECFGFEKREHVHSNLWKSGENCLHIEGMILLS